MNYQSTDGAHTGVNFVVRHALVAAGTTTFAGVDLKDFIGDLKVVLATFSPIADGSTTCQVSFLDSSDNSTFATFAGAPTYAPITGATGLLSTTLDTRACRRYVQAKYVVTGTTATFDVAVIGFGLKQLQ